VPTQCCASVIDDVKISP